MKGLIGEDM
jgi:hypothetical protein